MSAARLAGRRALRRICGPCRWWNCRLGATEDRVLGALDIEAALTRGVKAFEPGLFAKAHRGFSISTK